MNKRARLLQQLADTTARWQRLHVRLSRLRLARELETRVEEQLRLDAVIADTGASSAQLDMELEGLELRLAALPAAGAAHAVPERPLIFWSYAKADQELSEELASYVYSLPGADQFQHFDRQRVPLGQEPARLVVQKLQDARIVLLLISPDYLADEEIDRNELRLAMLRHDNQQSVVIPVLLRNCLWGESPLARLQVLPRGQVPICSWPEREPVLRAVALQIYHVTMQLVRPVSADVGRAR